MSEQDQADASGREWYAGSTGVDYVVCDVFVPRGRSLAGNQLAVFPGAEGLSGGLRSALAREMNYSESIFLTDDAQPDHATVAIYTPAAEIPFAGHPLLGAAAVLADAGAQRVTLRTVAHEVALEVAPAGRQRAQVWMTQPWPQPMPVDAQGIAAALRVGADTPVAGMDNGAPYALVRLPDRESVARLSPDMEALKRLSHGVLCFAGEGDRFKARMFAPAIGVAEDPATGSAAGPLVVHLHELGLVDRGVQIEIEQGTEIGRPSTLRARVDAGDAREPRVRVGGEVVIVAGGRFTLDRSEFDGGRPA